METEKRDIHNIGLSYEHRIAKLDELIHCRQNRQIAYKFIRDCEIGKTLRNAQKKKIGAARLLRMIWILKEMSNTWLKKPYDQVTENDMESFIRDIEKGKIRSLKGKPYSLETQITIKKFLRKFYKWLIGNGANYPEMVSWIDTSGKLKEIEALKREEVEKLAEHAVSIKNKAMIMLLFDSGARIDEFLNLRVADVERRNDYYQIRIKFSKTKPRTVSVSLCTKILTEYLAQHPDSNNPTAFLFDINYAAVLMMLRRLGQKVLKKRVYPHLFRHSSASYYANIIKQRFQFCYRYGWAMSSDMPDRYIDRNGLIEQETAEAIKVDEISRYKRDNELMKEEIRRLHEKYDVIVGKLIGARPALNKCVDGKV